MTVAPEAIAVVGAALTVMVVAPIAAATDTNEPDAMYWPLAANEPTSVPITNAVVNGVVKVMVVVLEEPTEGITIAVSETTPTIRIPQH
jgi:hypothetical protein